MRRYDPVPGHANDPTGISHLARTVAAVAGRVDATQRHLDTLTDDVHGITRGLAALTEQLRGTLTEQTISRPTPAPDPAQLPGTAPAGLVSGGQRDWAGVRDPDLAITWLRDVDQWLTDITAPAGYLPVLPSCWAVHPGVVIDVLALHTEALRAWANPAPTPVSEWLARWLPQTRTRVLTALSDCLEQRHHRQTTPGTTRTRGYDTRPLDRDSVAAWWATTHGRPPAPEFFGLHPIDT